MRSPVEVEGQVAITLHYLSDEGRLRKTANAYRPSRPCISAIVQCVACVITAHLGPKYTKLLFNEEVRKKVTHVILVLQCLGAIDGTHIDTKTAFS